MTTFKRVQAAQRLTGQTPINGWLGLVLYLVISPVLYAYMQSGLNSAWKAQAIESEQAVCVSSRPRSAASRRIRATARVSPSSSNRCGTQLPSSCAGP